MNAIASRIFAALPQARYVALLVKDDLQLAQRPDIANASAAESDKYEELLVNPTLLELARRRGNIDCGGLDWFLIRYGNFYQFVHPIRDGHLAVAYELDANPLEHVELVRTIAREGGLR